MSNMIINMLPSKADKQTKNIIIWKKKNSFLGVWGHLLPRSFPKRFPHCAVPRRPRSRACCGRRSPWRPPTAQRWSTGWPSWLPAWRRAKASGGFWSVGAAQGAPSCGERGWCLGFGGSRGLTWKVCLWGKWKGTVELKCKTLQNYNERRSGVPKWLGLLENVFWCWRKLEWHAEILWRIKVEASFYLLFHDQSIN